jgi:hypothetical protein
MTALERKENSEQMFINRGLAPLRDILPPMEEDDQINIRSGEDLARRLLVLSYLNCVALQPELGGQIVRFLTEESLWQIASAREQEIFSQGALSDEDQDYVAWRNESIWVMLWALNKFDVLDFPTEPIDASKLIKMIPAFFESTDGFVAAAATRSKDEIMQQADLYFRLCWAVHESDRDKSVTLPFDGGVAFERHFAIEWIKQVRSDWEDD